MTNPVAGLSLKDRVKRIAPFMVAGPISGPLLAATVWNFKSGHPVLGSLYGTLMVTTELSLSRHAGVWLHHLIH